MAGLNLATFETRSSYGRTYAYPVSDEAHALCALTGTKTLPAFAIGQAWLLGVSILNQQTGQPIRAEDLG
jgi:hypothetical protein